MGLALIRNEKAEARRSMILTLTEQVISLLRDSGATEEETLAVLDCVRVIIPLQEFESSKSPRFWGQ